MMNDDTKHSELDELPPNLPDDENEYMNPPSDGDVTDSKQTVAALNDTDIMASHPIPDVDAGTDEAHPETDDISNAPEFIDAIMQGIDAINNRVSLLDRKFDNRLAQDTSKETIINKMHEELQMHRQDISYKLMLPLVRSLIRIHDDLEDMTRVALSDPPTEAEQQLIAGYEDMAAMLRSRLEEHGFTPYQWDSQAFDAKWQKPSKRIETDDSSLDQQIADRLRWGFAYGDRVIRPEFVTVYRVKLPGTEHDA
jgi:molecular chaperone GrpE